MRPVYFLAFMLPILSMAAPLDRAVVMAEEGRVKIQFSIPKEHSLGSFQLRSILLKDNLQNDQGNVDTKDALNPLQIYDYLYEGTGNYVFSVLLPLEDSNFYCSYSYPQSVAFHGVSAQKLWEVLSRHLPKIENEYAERYDWGSENSRNFCSKTNPALGQSEYSCWIGF